MCYYDTDLGCPAFDCIRSAGRVEPRAGLGRANIGRGHGFRVLHGREVLPPVVGGDAEETEDNLGRREGGEMDYRG